MPVKFLSANDQSLRAIPEATPIVVNLVAGSVDNVVYVADQPVEVVAVRECHSGLGAASSTLDIKKCVGTEAPASGTTVLAAAFALDSTANTVVTKSESSGLSATLANRKLAPGDRLSIDLTGTITSLIGTVTIYVKQLRTAGGSV